MGGHSQPRLHRRSGHLLRRSGHRFHVAQRRVLGHFAEFDDLCTVDDRVEMQSHLLLLDNMVEVFEYPGTWHFFAEDAELDTPAGEAAALAWGRTVAFLQRHLGLDDG
nr:dienelactone hydrolase family protein [Candidatus Microthrix sp.]